MVWILELLLCSFYLFKMKFCFTYNMQYTVCLDEHTQTGMVCVTLGGRGCKQIVCAFLRATQKGMFQSLEFRDFGVLIDFRESSQFSFGFIASKTDKVEAETQ